MLHVAVNKIRILRPGSRNVREDDKYKARSLHGRFTGVGDRAFLPGERWWWSLVGGRSRARDRRQLSVAIGRAPGTAGTAVC